MATFIDDQDFDDQLRRTLTAAAAGCADLGEALVTAGRITPGDFGSWHREWAKTAGQVRDEGDDSYDAGHLASAAGCYLRACEYYRQAFFFARDDLDSPVLLDTYAAHRASFLAALPALDWPVTPAEIPYQGTTLNGYLARPDDSGRARPTVIAPAGYDSTAEAGYAATAVAALRRGLNCLLFEGPGQGGVLYEQRLYFRPDYEAVLTPVVDWLVSQPGVDPGQLVLFGRSFAGYLAARGATGEHRVAALICDPVHYDFAAGIQARLGDDPQGKLDGLLADPRQASAYRTRMVTHGAPTIGAYLAELSRFSLAGLAGQITCPVLALEAEGDFASQGQVEPFAAELTSPVTTHRFTAAEGAGGHCEGLGQTRLERVVYDWVAGVLA
jgi:hypothetical protein